jgi:hypothetical protein
MTSVRRYNLLYCGTQLLARDLHSEPVFESLSTSLHVQVARHARQRLFVRAGVVAWRDRAIVVLAHPPAETTSLVAALCSVGARYYSDVFAVFDQTGRVHPYMSSPHTGPQGRSAEPVTVQAGAPSTQANAALPVALILDTVHEADTRTPVHALSPGQAVMALLSCVVPGRASATFALRALQRVTQNAITMRGAIADRQETMGRILNRMNG